MTRLVLLGMLTLVLTGCGTVENLREPQPSAAEKQYWQRFWGVEESRPLPVPAEGMP